MTSKFLEPNGTIWEKTFELVVLLGAGISDRPSAQGYALKQVEHAVEASDPQIDLIPYSIRRF